MVFAAGGVCCPPDVDLQSVVGQFFGQSGAPFDHCHGLWGGGIEIQIIQLLGAGEPVRINMDERRTVGQ